MANILYFPKLTIQIEGKNQVTDIYSLENFQPLLKSERTSILNSSKGWISVYSANSLPIRKVIIEAPYFNSSVETAYTVSVKTIYSGASGTVENVQSIEGLNIINYPAAWGATIQDIQISTSSVSDRTIKTSIYNW